MAYERFCGGCGKVVTCREERRPIDDSLGLYASTLSCPECERKLATLYT